ncbi:MAG: hypothetical protein QOE69_2786 [Thermoleophilaceae bacterium]|jgi:hypothetical protein|nr:hypothetical protein [Thermoleophilaceae bacterium]
MRVTIPFWVAGLLLVLPGAAEAASYRFKVDLTVVQTSDWAESVRHPAPGDGYCGERDVHYVYKGEGGGQLKAKIRGGRVTFKGNGRALQSSEIKVPGTVLTDASPYTVEMVGVPDDQCDVPPPPPFPNQSGEGGCHQLIRRPGTARSFLLAIGGRLNLTGGFYRRDKRSCSDPSLYTGLLGFGGRPKRNDVNALIMNKRVRSIELSSSDTTKFTRKNLSDFGANSETVAGSGEGRARWSVKLTRLR